MLHTNGFTTLTPAFRKSCTFRVATIKPWTKPVAAIKLSLTGISWPPVRRSARSLAHAGRWLVPRVGMRF